jgi:TRAP-type C4-dicarboxylate transport system permease large subunit
MRSKMPGRAHAGNAAVEAVGLRMRVCWRERRTTFKPGIGGMYLIVIILGGIHSGIFTPSEAVTVAWIIDRAFVVVCFLLYGTV